MAEKRQNEIYSTDTHTDTQTAPTLPIVGSKIFFEPTKIIDLKKNSVGPFSFVKTGFNNHRRKRFSLLVITVGSFESEL